LLASISPLENTLSSLWFLLFLLSFFLFFFFVDLRDSRFRVRVEKEGEGKRMTEVETFVMPSEDKGETFQSRYSPQLQRNVYGGSGGGGGGGGSLRQGTAGPRRRKAISVVGAGNSPSLGRYSGSTSSARQVRAMDDLEVFNGSSPTSPRSMVKLLEEIKEKEAALAKKLEQGKLEQIALEKRLKAEQRLLENVKERGLELAKQLEETGEGGGGTTSITATPPAAATTTTVTTITASGELKPPLAGLSTLSTASGANLMTTTSLTTQQQQRTNIVIGEGGTTDGEGNPSTNFHVKRVKPRSNTMTGQSHPDARPVNQPRTKKRKKNVFARLLKKSSAHQKIGRIITKDDKSYELMFDMLLGIRVTVSTHSLTHTYIHTHTLSLSSLLFSFILFYSL
jgi:hypothetical protein